MTELMNTLYEFISNRRMGDVWNDPEYRSFSSCAQIQEEKLRARLDGEGEKILDDLLAEQRGRHYVELQVMFQSALALCRELSQILSRP